MLNQRDKLEDVVHKDPATEILENKFCRQPIHLLSSAQICLGVIFVICQIVIYHQSKRGQEKLFLPELRLVV